jgi:hypothetical protein
MASVALALFIFLAAAIALTYYQRKERQSHLGTPQKPRPNTGAQGSKRILQLNDPPLPSTGTQDPPPQPASVPQLRKLKDRPGPRCEALRQNLRIKVTYDEAKIDRLIHFERDELKRKGGSEATVEDLMERAIERWERENHR